MYVQEFIYPVTCLLSRNMAESNACWLFRKWDDNHKLLPKTSTCSIELFVIWNKNIHTPGDVGGRYLC